MTAFEPQTSGIRSNCSTNWAKTTAQCRCLLEQETAYLYRAWFHKTDSGTNNLKSSAVPAPGNFKVHGRNQMSLKICSLNGQS